MKNSMTPAGIEPATFRFVAQQLNHCATAVRLNVDGSAIRWIGEARASGALCDHANELSERSKECNELWMFIAML